MTNWMCDHERCYRSAVLVRLTDGRERPRCDRHRPTKALDVVRKTACGASVVQPKIEWVADTGFSDLIRSGFYDNYKRAMERIYSANLLGVYSEPPVEIPQAKDGEPIYWHANVESAPIKPYATVPIQ